MDRELIKRERHLINDLRSEYSSRYVKYRVSRSNYVVIRVSDIEREIDKSGRYSYIINFNGSGYTYHVSDKGIDRFEYGDMKFTVCCNDIDKISNKISLISRWRYRIGLRKVIRGMIRNNRKI